MGLLAKLVTPASSNPDEVRMTLGEHLEELRTRIIRALVAVAIGAAVCYWFIGYIQAFLCWPVFTVYQKHHMPTKMSTLGPSEGFFTDLWVAMVVGLIVSAPYSIAQIWGFVAAGLYPNERKWVRGFAPVSIGLFFVGALFLIIVVNPLLMDFLLTYRTELPDVERVMPSFLVKSSAPALLAVDPDPAVGPVTPADEATSRPATTTAPATAPTAMAAIPIFDHDPPASFPQGVIWLNRAESEIRVRYAKATLLIAHLEETNQRNRLVPEMRYSEVVPFTLELAGAFGIGFQVPVVVAFLAAIGIFSAKDMAAYRRHVIFVMSIAAAVITPSPDPFSMSLLLIPMIGLFEAGLFAARVIERNRSQSEAEAG